MQAAIKLLYLFLLVAVAGCKKGDPNPTFTAAPQADYMKLNPGNYWIYNEYKVNPSGETNEQITDSAYVEKDTTINGMVYHKLLRPTRWAPAVNSIFYLRDSLDYVIDHRGKIMFSASDFTTVFYTHHEMALHDTLWTLTTRMADKDYTVKTGGGVFITSALLTSYALGASISPAKPVLLHHTRYAKDVGMITEVVAFYSHNPEERWERRLVRWHVK